MNSRRLARVLTVDEMRAHARRRLPGVIYDAIEGGAGDEQTLEANRDAFRQIWFRPEAFADVERRDLSTDVLGQRVSMPLLMAPCGLTRMMHPDAELAAARAAARAGTIYAVSTASSYGLEEIARASDGCLWFQLYLPQARHDAESLLDRVAAAGYRTLCLNIDSPITPKRERDYRNGLTVPMRVTPKLALALGRRPRWAKNFLVGKVGRGGDLSFHQGRTAYQRLATTVASFHAVTFSDLEWLRERWDGRLVVKGIQRGDECRRIVSAGVDGLVVSNHGGRNLDGALPTIDVLPEVVAAANGEVEVYLDGGVRRGSDVVKALALGARACFIGRPYLYGLAVAGEAGVTQILEILRGEIDGTMALLGCAAAPEVSTEAVVRRDGTRPHFPIHL